MEVGPAAGGVDGTRSILRARAGGPVVSGRCGVLTRRGPVNQVAQWQDSDIPTWAAGPGDSQVVGAAPELGPPLDSGLCRTTPTRPKWLRLARALTNFPLGRPGLVGV